MRCRYRNPPLRSGPAPPTRAACLFLRRIKAKPQLLTRNRTACQRRVRLMPVWRKLLLTVHVLTTVGLFGADLVLLTLGITSLLEAEPRTIYPAAATVGRALLGPLAVASLATGLLLGVLTQW